MPSDTPAPALAGRAACVMTGRCYCGATALAVRSAPQTVVYCHCSDCRRVTGAPVAAFAAFAADDLEIHPDPGPFSAHSGVDRWFCRDCGSPMAARFDYLPGQIYVPVGVLDQAAMLKPELHAHAESGLPWLHIDDTLTRVTGSSRTDLLSAGTRNRDVE